MATSLKNLSLYDISTVPDATGVKTGIVVSEWNEEVTGALCKGAIDTLLKHGAKREDIVVYFVPGSFELTSGAHTLAEEGTFNGIICLGCIVRGETPHFDYICQGVTQGITQLNLSYPIPFIFGVLTTNSLREALDRAGGKHGNKGDEAAISLLKMVAFRRMVSGTN